MKLRKALIAGATAATLLTAGTVSPAFAADDAGVTTPVKKDDGNGTPANTDKGSAASSSEDWKNMTSKEKSETIKNWLGVATAVIGVLTAIAGFAAKYFPMPK